MLVDDFSVAQTPYPWISYWKSLHGCLEKNSLDIQTGKGHWFNSQMSGNNPYYKISPGKKCIWKGFFLIQVTWASVAEHRPAYSVGIGMNNTCENTICILKMKVVT